jgi:hypothetical protein
MTVPRCLAMVVRRRATLHNDRTIPYDLGNRIQVFKHELNKQDVMRRPAINPEYCNIVRGRTITLR